MAMENPLQKIGKSLENIRKILEIPYRGLIRWGNHLEMLDFPANHL
jgi:hypothetical protein